MAHRVGSRHCGNTAGVGGEADNAKDIAQPTRMTQCGHVWLRIVATRIEHQPHFASRAFLLLS